MLRPRLPSRGRVLRAPCRRSRVPAVALFAVAIALLSSACELQRFGINSAAYQSPDLMPTLVQGGVKYGRVDLGYDFTSDAEDTAIFDFHTTRGMAVQPILNFLDTTHVSTVDPTTFANWAVSRIEKFGPRGAYWAGKTPAQQALAPDAWEVVNEPDCKPCGSQAEPQAYAHLYMATYDAVKAAGLTVDAGGQIRLGFYTIGDYQRPDGTWSQVDDGKGWLNDALAAEPRLRNAINAAGGMVIHPYGAINQSTSYNYGWGRITLYHTMATNAGITAKEWVTEAGYQVGCTGDDTCVPDAATQSANVDQMVREVKARPYILMFDYFNAKDYTEWRGGLFDSSGSARPAWNTYSYDVTH